MVSLAATRLAPALSIQPGLTAFVAWDRRLLDAGEAAGLPAASPSWRQGARLAADIVPAMTYPAAGRAQAGPR